MILIIKVYLGEVAISLFKSKRVKGVIGIEIRADGLAYALRKKGQPNQASVCGFKECSAAQRAAALKSIVDENNCKGFACHLILNPDQYKVYPIEKPAVEPEELSEAARWKIKDILDFDVEDAISDVFDYPQDALRGRPEQLNVAVGRRAVVQESVNLINGSGLQLLAIDIAELALSGIAHRFDIESEMPKALLYLRGGLGMMVLVKNDALYLSRRFDFSLDALNEPSQQDSVLQQLSLEVQRSFDYFESQMGQVPPKNLVLVGPAPNIPLENMLGGSISARVEAVDWAQVMPAAETVDQGMIDGFIALGGAIREVQA